MGCLPDQVGQEQQKSESSAKPEPTTGEVLPVTSEDQPHHDAEAEEEHADLVLEAEASDQAEGDPPPEIFRPQKLSEYEDCQGPKHDIERVHRENAEDADIDRSQGGRQPSEDLSPPSAPQVVRNPTYEKNGDASRDGWKEPQSQLRLAKKRSGQPAEPADQRWVFHVAETQVTAIGDVVELIAEHSISVARSEDMQEGSDEPE
jgi:hypothetical protein